MTYILDANAMIAILNDEPGAELLGRILSPKGTVRYAHAINVCEVFYDALRESGEDKAQEALADIQSLGIETRSDMDDELWQSAGRVKASHRISLADAFAIAFTLKVNGRLLTSDHHELDALASAGVCPITFFR